MINTYADAPLLTALSVLRKLSTDIGNGKSAEDAIIDLTIDIEEGIARIEEQQRQRNNTHWWEIISASLPTSRFSLNRMLNGDFSTK